MARVSHPVMVFAAVRLRRPDFAMCGPARYGNARPGTAWQGPARSGRVRSAKGKSSGDGLRNGSTPLAGFPAGFGMEGSGWVWLGSVRHV